MTESRLAEDISQKVVLPEGEDRTEMKKESKLLRCTFLNGSAWSTVSKYMRRCKEKCDVFFGIEHRMRKEEMEEQFNKEAKAGWRFAADAAGVTNGRAGSEDRKHTSGEYLWQSTATWERFWSWKKGRLSRSQAMKEELRKNG